MVEDAMVIVKFDAGWRLIESLAKRGLDVRAALWAKPVDEKWRLFLSCPVVDDKGSRFAYGVIHAALRETPDAAIDPFEIVAVGVEDSMGRAAAELATALTPAGGGPRRELIPFDGLRLGRVSVEGAYIYPVGHLSTASGRA